EQTGVDAVMIGRAALGDPWIFRRVTHYLDTGELLPMPTPREKAEMAVRHLRMAVDFKGEPRAVREMRKHIAWYLKGVPGSARIKRLVQEMTEADRVAETLLEFVDGLGAAADEPVETPRARAGRAARGGRRRPGGAAAGPRRAALRARRRWSGRHDHGFGAHRRQAHQPQEAAARHRQKLGAAGRGRVAAGRGRGAGYRPGRRVAPGDAGRSAQRPPGGPGRLSRGEQGRAGGAGPGGRRGLRPAAQQPRALGLAGGNVGRGAVQPGAGADFPAAGV